MKFIQDRFETDVEVNGSKIHFCDAIVLPEDEYNKLTLEEIETQKAERVNNFKFNIENPPPEVKPTPEQELEQVKAELAQYEALLAKKPELEAKKVELEVAVAEIKPIEEKPVIEGEVIGVG